ncbi:MAG: inositol monophosphatase family protein, partial [Pseudomonadota bacterium]
YWEHNLNSWDIAAGILMVREAGGFVSDLQGKNKMLETGDVLVGNEYAHRLILRLLKQAETAA